MGGKLEKRGGKEKKKKEGFNIFVGFRVVSFKNIISNLALTVKYNTFKTQEKKDGKKNGDFVFWEEEEIKLKIISGVPGQKGKKGENRNKKRELTNCSGRPAGGRRDFTTKSGRKTPTLSTPATTRPAPRPPSWATTTPPASRSTCPRASPACSAPPTRASPGGVRRRLPVPQL